MNPATRLWTVFVSLTLTPTSLDATLQRFKESPGLYYDHIGEAQLYNTEWKILTYINLQEADQNLETVRKYDQLSMDKAHKQTYWINPTDCTNITRYIDNQIKEVEDLKSIVRQLTRTEDKNYLRFKIGVVNFIGGISKIHFGTMDNEDALYYAEKISSLEKEQIDFLKLSKEQITVVKTTLRSDNSTLSAVSENEKVLSKGLEKMVKHINEHDDEIKNMFSGTCMLLTVNEYTMQLQRAINE
jgi:hypothetical protein